MSIHALTWRLEAAWRERVGGDEHESLASIATSECPVLWWLHDQPTRTWVTPGIDSRDADNEVLGSSYDKKRGTAITTSSQDIPVDLAAVSAPNLDNVRIVIEEKSSTPKWDSRGEATEAVQPHTDDVMVLGAHIDAGGPLFSSATGAPTKLPPATITWSLGSNGALTATYNGYLHLDGFAGSARVVLRAITWTDIASQNILRQRIATAARPWRLHRGRPPAVQPRTACRERRDERPLEGPPPDRAPHRQSCQRSRRQLAELEIDGELAI